MSAVTSSHAAGPAVLCLVGWWPGPSDATGIFIKEHVRAIQRSHRVIVVHTVVRKGPLGWPSATWSSATEDGIEVVRVSVTTPVRRFGLHQWAVSRALRKLVHGLHAATPFGLVHVHVRTEETEVACTLAREIGVPVVVTEHNSYYHLGIRKLPPATQRDERVRIRRWFADPIVRAVMPVSNDLAEVLERDFGVDGQRIVVVPNVATDDFRPGPGPAPGQLRLVLSAVWRPPKDPDTFIEALALLPHAVRRGISIHWVGYGPDLERIKGRCERDIPDARIQFTGMLDKASFGDLLRSAHLFVLPTKADNLPCVVIESLCCGTPVLSMRVNGLPELVSERNGQLVAPGDVTALAQALDQAVRSPDRFDRGNIAAEAMARYSIAAVAHAIQGVYRTVLADAR